MAPDLTRLPSPQSIDLTGLPEQTELQVLQLVRAARDKQVEALAPRSPNQDDPGRWSAGHLERPIALDDDRESIYAGCGE